jgi:hypothetical protein
MKTGITLDQLASKLTDIQQNKRDYVSPVSDLHMTPEGTLSVADFGQFGLNNHSGGQVATYTGIPKQYFDRITAENSALLAQMVNHGFNQAVLQATLRAPANRMVRTYDGNVRALLSSKYRPLDCIDLLENVAPVILNGDQPVEMKSTELTERRMYLKMVFPRLEGEVKTGDPVQFGLVISSSDVGAGSVRVEPLIYRLVCSNGMITESAIRKFHVGKNQAQDSGYELFSDRTKEVSDQAFWMQVKDVVQNNLRPEIFELELAKIREASGEEIKNYDLKTVIDNTAREVGITNEAVKHSMVEYLAKGADGAGMNKWGLANAFTYAAQAQDVDYEDATELERAGHKVLTLSRSKFEAVAA